jgi:2-desacetyl-2-hydroxyethyl bacteriochlorophyllide A dehydrogenase
VNARAVVIVRPRLVEVQDAALELVPGPGEVVVRSEVSAISAGTELLFYRGQLEDGVAVDGTLSALATPLAYPLRYGYCTVGRVTSLGAGVEGPWEGKRVFAFSPHQSHLRALTDSLTVIPDNVSAEAATFLANVETAVSLVMDAMPVLGERALVMGQGVVGQLVAALLTQLGVEPVVVGDRSAFRLERAKAFAPGVRAWRAGTQPLDDRNFDLAFELTGDPSALPEALSHLAFEGRLVVGSWYGSKVSPLALGTHAHRNRNTVLFSQVSHIDSRHAARFDKARRMAVALRWLQRLPVATLVTHRFDFERAAEAYRLLDSGAEGCLQTLLVHGRVG